MNRHLFSFRFVVLMLLLVLLCGCSNRQLVSGTNTYEGSDCINALDISKDDTIDMAISVVSSEFDTLRTLARTNEIHTSNESPFWGNATMTIKVKEVRAKSNKATSGYVYEVMAKGKGLNASLMPQYIVDRYASALDEYTEVNGIRKIRICGFEDVDIKGALNRSSGTCWLVDSRGYLITCEHVVGRKRALEVVLANGTTRDATVVLTDKTNDLAILKIDPLPEEYRPIPVELRAISNVGEPVYILGFPAGEDFGNALKMSDGIISAQLGFRNNTTEYQINGSINGGNSGGPVFDSRGTAVGVVSSKLVAMDAEGIAYIKKSNGLALLFAQVGISPLPSVSETFTAEEIYSQYRNSVFLIRRN